MTHVLMPKKYPVSVIPILPIQPSWTTHGGHTATCREWVEEYVDWAYENLSDEYCEYLSQAFINELYRVFFKSGSISGTEGILFFENQEDAICVKLRWG